MLCFRLLFLSLAITDEKQARADTKSSSYNRSAKKVSFLFGIKWHDPHLQHRLRCNSESQAKLSSLLNILLIDSHFTESRASGFSNTRGWTLGIATNAACHWCPIPRSTAHGTSALWFSLDLELCWKLHVSFLGWTFNCQCD